MSRVEELREFLEVMKTRYSGNKDDIFAQLMLDQVQLLKDISISLAVIADKLDDKPESDAYVRDHQLIQWAYDHKYWLDGGSTIEDIYKHWMEDVGGKL